MNLLAFLFLMTSELAVASLPTDVLDNDPDTVVCALRLEEHVRMVQRNGFKTDTTLAKLKLKFGKGFAADLAALGTDDQYFDSGSGAGIALLDYQKEGKAKTLGVVVALPEGVKKVNTTRHRILDEVYVETLDAAVIGPTKVLSDFYGPAAYALHFERVINKYLEVVVVGGTINLAVDEYETYVTTKEGVKYKYIDYLKLRLRGHDIEPTDPPIFRFRVTAKGPKRLPRLKLVTIAASTPSFREYEEL